MKWLCVLALTLLVGCSPQAPTDPPAGTIRQQDELTPPVEVVDPAPLPEPEPEPAPQPVPEPEPEPELPPPELPDLDGKWRLTGPISTLEACITIAGDKITAWDPGCSVEWTQQQLDEALADINADYDAMVSGALANLASSGLLDTSMSAGFTAGINENRQDAIDRARLTYDVDLARASLPVVVCDPFDYDGTTVSWQVTLLPVVGGAPATVELRLQSEGSCWAGTFDYLDVTLCRDS